MPVIPLRNFDFLWVTSALEILLTAGIATLLLSSLLELLAPFVALAVFINSDTAQLQLEHSDWHFERQSDTLTLCEMHLLSPVQGVVHV